MPITQGASPMDLMVKSYMKSDLFIIDMESTIEVLIKVLSKIRHTCIPVLDSDAKCFGIVSSIDVFDFLANGGNPKETKAWEICSHGVIHVPVHFNIIEAADLMTSHSIHHLIICNEGRPGGILSSLDLLRLFRSKEYEIGLAPQSDGIKAVVDPVQRL